MITEHGVLANLPRADRLTLASAFAVCVDDASPQVGAVLADWTHTLGCRVPMLSSWTTDELDQATLGELVILLGSSLFWVRVGRLCVSIDRWHAETPDIVGIGVHVRALIDAIVARRAITDPETASVLASARKAKA